MVGVGTAIIDKSNGERMKTRVRNTSRMSDRRIFF